MEKYLIQKAPAVQSTQCLLGDDPLTSAKPLILGVLGHSSAPHWTLRTLTEELCHPVLAELGRMPDAILMPSDGATSFLLQGWAERQKIPLTPFTADWTKLGKRAGMLRDSRIVKDSTHLVVFLGKRSDSYMKMAIREVKKGKCVFTVDAETHEVVQWEI